MKSPKAYPALHVGWISVRHAVDGSAPHMQLADFRYDRDGAIDAAISLDERAPAYAQGNPITGYRRVKITVEPVD